MKVGETMIKFETNKISRNEFAKINEEDVMFITNPGRMGDENGSTFIVRNGNDFIIYRIDGWMYPSKDSEIISIEDVTKKFPKWSNAWEHGDNDKYKYIYMGFGNGLCVDNSIYSEFEPYLNKLVEEYLSDKEDKESLKYAAVFNTWKDAFISMVNDKKYILK